MMRLLRPLSVCVISLVGTTVALAQSGGQTGQVAPSAMQQVAPNAPQVGALPGTPGSTPQGPQQQKYFPNPAGAGQANIPAGSTVRPGQPPMNTRYTSGNSTPNFPQPQPGDPGTKNSPPQPEFDPNRVFSSVTAPKGMEDIQQVADRMFGASSGASAAKRAWILNEVTKRWQQKALIEQWK